jgi:ATP-binding cassette subfamily C protein LapB
MVGIQGENGSGKTALLHLIMGRLQPDEGQLIINDQPASSFDLNHIRKQIAYLPSQPVLMRGTILDNLTFFRKGDHLDESLEIAAWLGLDEIFARMPDGYDTRVGEAVASTLPHGVAQRVAIARALALKPRFILFDEANSALDQAGETYLKQVLEQLHGKTGIIMVTYRPSLLNMADRKFQMSGGELHELTPNTKSKTMTKAAKPTKKGDDA